MGGGARDLKVPSTWFYGERQCMLGWRCGMSGCGVACEAQTGRVSGRGLRDPARVWTRLEMLVKLGERKRVFFGHFLFVTRENGTDFAGSFCERGRVWAWSARAPARQGVVWTELEPRLA